MKQPSIKRLQNNDSEDDSASQKKAGGKDLENARNVHQRPTELKSKQR